MAKKKPASVKHVRGRKTGTRIQNRIARSKTLGPTVHDVRRAIRGEGLRLPLHVNGLPGLLSFCAQREVPIPNSYSIEELCCMIKYQAESKVETKPSTVASSSAPVATRQLSLMMDSQASTKVGRVSKVPRVKKEGAELKVKQQDVKVKMEEVNDKGGLKVKKEEVKEEDEDIDVSEGWHEEGEEEEEEEEAVREDDDIVEDSGSAIDGEARRQLDIVCGKLREGRLTRGVRP
eukprot:TRINITY_DN12017_c0_g1_i1.p1 TRINITY_DN12017_c0_g1~~TRINITY_DN12017_c0_g1_i1.p1  ORF type:complete len:260 (-),score=61.98 TRINITY_DN12017_c0_g1_i1:82-780(-)